VTDDEICKFVYTHVGTWRRAFMGFADRFDAPEFKRAPFQGRRLERLVREGRIERVGEQEGKTGGYYRVPELMPSRKARRK
jgi:hypothetical protein